jgi:hypothetical protein
MELHRVPWASLLTGDGRVGAGIVADTLLALKRCAPAEVDGLTSRLEELLIHGHSAGVSEAGAHSVPFLVEIAAGQPKAREAMAELLEHTATGWPVGSVFTGSLVDYLALVRRDLTDSVPLMRQIPQLTWLANLVAQQIVPGGQVREQWAPAGRAWQTAGRYQGSRQLRNVAGLIAATEFNGHFELIDPATGTTVCAGSRLRDAHVMRSGMGILAVSAEMRSRKATLWDVTSGEPRELAKVKKKGWMFASHGETLLLADETRRVRLIDPRRGTAIGTLLRHDRRLRMLDVHADTIVGMDIEQRIICWEASTGRPMYELGSFNFPASLASCCLADGRTVLAVTGVDSRFVECFDLRTGELLWRNDLPGGPLCAFETSAGPRFALGSFRQIVIVDAMSGERAGDLLSGHQSDVTGLAVAAVGDRQALFSCDSTEVWRWDLATGAPWP